MSPVSAHPASHATSPASSVPSARGAVAGLVVVAMLIASAAVLTAARERRYPTPTVSEESLYVTSGTVARRLSLGFQALAADLYWIRAIQYYGGTKIQLTSGQTQAQLTAADHGQNGYPLLYPMLDLTTTLDPRFNIAYRFGSIFLAEPFPGGAGRPDLALELLKKGLEANPTKWEYMQDAGFVEYWWRHDYHAAAEWFRKASEVDGAPWWLKSLAATTLAEGGDRTSSRTMWQAILQSAEIEWLKGDAERRLTQLNALDQIDNLQALLERGRQRGLEIRDWNTVIRAGGLPGIPVDPTGTPYEIDAQGRVQLSQRSSLYPLPNEPQRLQPIP